MLVGHYAVGLAIKRLVPQTSLGTFVLAAMLADLLWCVFMIAGIDHVQFRHGMGAANYLEATNIAMSHSLLMDAIWAALLAAAYFWRKLDARAAAFVFLAVVSHWLLDFVSHRPDMPLAPGVRRSLGLGLWTSIPATFIVEGGFWLLAIILYARAARPKPRAWAYTFWSGIIVLTLLWWSNIAGPPPRNPAIAPFASLTIFSLSVAWAYWVNRLGGPQPVSSLQDG